MGSFIQDLRYGLRTMNKSRGFTALAIIALALGIGANTAIFSVINAVLLRPLPFKEPEGLVTVCNVDLKQGTNFYFVTWPDFIDWRAQGQTFESLAAFDARDLTFTGAGEPVRLRGAMVTSNLFPMVGVAPQLGRGFTPEEDQPGTHAVLLSHGFWRRRFSADPNVVGRTVGINGRSYSVAGVMPAGFNFPLGDDTVEMWINAAVDHEGPAPLTQQRGNHAIEAIGRLKPGASLAQAQAELGRIAANLASQYDTNTDFSATAMPLTQRLVGDARLALLLLLAAVGCVLLIACANVANLLLARAAARQKEIAVRAAMGAGRWRVVRQLLTESVVLALSGGAVGLLLAWWGTDFLLGLVPRGLPRAAEIAPDARVLGFTVLLAAATGVIFGLAPALHSAKVDLTEALKESGRGAGARGNRLRSSLIVAQVAIAFVLLVCAGLLINGFWRLQRVKPGFDTRNVLSFRISLPVTQYSEPPQVENFYRQLLARIEALPGVTAASAATALPLSGQNSELGFAIEGAPTEPARPFPHNSYFRVVRTGYFRTMGIELLQGRDFEVRDSFSATPVVIINETLARKHFPNQNPLGRRINPSFAVDERGVLWREIIGVVRDVRHASLSEEAGEEVYATHSQATFNTISIVARTSNDPHSLISAARKEVAALDKDLPVYAVKTLEEYLASSVAQPRFNTLLLSLFAGLALILTAVGHYGVMAYSVAQRTHEIGVRVALGAQTRDVLGLVIRRGMALTLAGMAIGFAGAFALTRVMADFLFGVSATDPLTFGAIALLLAVVALLACYVPARRATKVDPMIALRNE